MGARQIAEAHQELAGDLATREGEGAAEQLHPFHLRQRMVGVEPGLEAAMTVAKQAYAPCVFTRRVELQTVAYDFGIAEQPCPLRGTVCGDRKSGGEETSMSVRVGTGGGGYIKKQ